jgi:Ca2+-binding RTX toxin-like protein
VIAVAPGAGGTVLNDDTTAIISITALEADRAEGEAGAAGFTFLLSRAGGTSGSADVGWLVEGDGVRPADGADFVGGALPSGSVSFAPGEMEKVLTVQVAGDTLREGNEGFVVSLVAQSGAELGTGTAVGTIRADEPLDDIIAVDVGTGLALASVPSFYSGPVPGLERELLAIVAQNVVAIASGPNWFIHTGSGDDAIRVQGGRNVLDGGTGSNFLTGADGEDTFFLDARDQTVPIWSTLVGFGVGDSATVWGLTQASAALMWEEGAGADGFTGLTLHAWRPGVDFASLTFAGFTRADLDSGRLGLVSGHDAASGSDFLLITGLPQS